jgi:hypothetical protein
MSRSFTAGNAAPSSRPIHAVLAEVVHDGRWAPRVVRAESLDDLAVA